MSILICENAAFAYDGKTVVRGLNFAVNTGDYLCIVGENGAGKSTLLKGLLGLKKPSEGRVAMGEGLKSTQIGYLPQQTAAQKDFPASVWEVVLSGRQNQCGLRPFYNRADKQAAAEALCKFGIEPLKSSCYRELSGGQQQRVLLARALCATSRLLLLDEPVSGLDPLVTAELYRLIAQLNRENSLTVIMVSHDVRDAVEQANHVLHLGQGAPFFGTRADYLASAQGRSFLGGGLC